MTSIKLKWIKEIVLLFVAVPLVSILLAQSAGTGALTGTVTDSSGAVIPNATVTAIKSGYKSGKNREYRRGRRLPPGVITAGHVQSKNCRERL